MSALDWLVLVIAVLAAALIIVIALHQIDARSTARLAERFDDMERQRDRLERKNRHLQERITGYRTDLVRLSADNGQLRARNAELVDQLADALMADLHALTAADPEEDR